MKKLVSLMCFCLLFLSPAFADWDPSDPYKMHYPQLPDPNGWDVCLCCQWIADDFRCTETGDITDIHFWISWNEDWSGEFGPQNLDVSIWSDGGGKPGFQLWQFMNGNMVIRHSGQGPQGWVCPSPPPMIAPNNHQQFFQVNITQINEPLRQFAGNTYWLVIKVNLLSPPWPNGPAVGWKTAIKTNPLYPPFQAPSQWSLDRLTWQPVNMVEPQIWDQAFVITNDAQQESLDFGDAPDPIWPTLLTSNGARHIIRPIGPWLGDPQDNPDPELDGQPTPNADGDDMNGYDDEDGVAIPVLTIGQTATITFQVSSGDGMGGRVIGWIDFNGSGIWGDFAAEQIVNFNYTDGVYSVPVTPPPGSVIGTTYARFRITRDATVTGPTGLAQDGEVEDYLVTIQKEPEPDRFDFGDAPDPIYPTLLTSNGARHLIVPTMLLGGLIDGEFNGQPTVPANGDDINPLSAPDDEDGVFFLTPLIPGFSSQIQVMASAPGILEAWIDFNRDGVWAMGLPEQIAISLPVGPGPTMIPFNVPAGAVLGQTYARFRYSTTIGLLPTGPASDGEVEDYRVLIEEEPVDMDFGDAPDQPYPTLLANNGAYHVIVPAVYMGAAIDAEPDGQPTPIADGDDVNPAAVDDEDGVVFLTAPLVAGFPAQVQITASVNGFIDAWIDFEKNGDWANPLEQIFTSQPVVTGVNILTFNVPTGLGGGVSSPVTYARFRFSTAGGLSYVGGASDGEVEDYQVLVEGEIENAADLGDAPDSTNNMLTTMTAYTGVQANFPTVFNDGSTPQGPIHWQARNIAYLGDWATLEVEADSGPDEDLLNNIDPTSNTPDLDNSDDGVFNMPLHLPYCDYTTFDYKITVGPSATYQTLYVNTWFDWNRDGDWDDVLSPVCSSRQVDEWAVQNQVFSVVGPGQYTITSSAFLSWHPILTGGTEEIWMRITLSEQPWIPMGGTLGDGGSGPASGYQVGETEDYLFVPDTSCVRCADLNCDGTVTLSDFAIFASRWLAICP